MSEDFWSDFTYGDQNFDGNVDYYDSMIVEDECKEIGSVSFSRHTTQQNGHQEVKHEPIGGSPFAVFAFECFYFLIVAIIATLISIIPWIIIVVGSGATDEPTNLVLTLSLITGICLSLFMTITFHYTNKKQLEEKRKNQGKDFI